MKDTNRVVPAVKVQRVGVHAEMQRLAPFRHVADTREGDDGSIEEELAVNALRWDPSAGAAGPTSAQGT